MYLLKIISSSGMILTLLCTFLNLVGVSGTTSGKRQASYAFTHRFSKSSSLEIQGRILPPKGSYGSPVLKQYNGDPDYAIKYYILKKCVKHSNELENFEEFSLQSLGQLITNGWKRLTILIHGFSSLPDFPYYGIDVFSRQNLLGLANYIFSHKINVVLLDWTKYGTQRIENYSLAAAKVGFVGNNALNLINEIVQQNIASTPNINCIGFDLGAHVCGQLGDDIKSNYPCKLGRIDGIDPAGPLFGKGQQFSNLRLYYTDAAFVAIHNCDPGGYGIEFVDEAHANFLFHRNQSHWFEKCYSSEVSRVTGRQAETWGGSGNFCKHMECVEAFYRTSLIRFQAKNYDTGVCFRNMTFGYRAPQWIRGQFVLADDESCERANTESGNTENCEGLPDTI